MKVRFYLLIPKRLYVGYERKTLTARTRPWGCHVDHREIAFDLELPEPHGGVAVVEPVEVPDA